MKNSKIEIRISEKEKEKLSEFAKQHNTTISSLIREYISNLLKQ